MTALGCQGGDDTNQSEPLVAEVMFVGSQGLSSHYPAARVNALARELEGSDADVICLTGVWGDEPRSTIVDALAPTFPHSLALPTHDDTAVDDPRDSDGMVPEHETGPPCFGPALVALDAALGCLVPCTEGQSTTSAVSSDACLSRPPCGNDVVALGHPGDPRARCVTCFYSHVRAGADLSKIDERCTTSSGNALAHDGEHGLLLLSRMPLSDPSLYVLPSETHRRVVLGARATTGGGNEVSVFCASLGHEELARLPGEPFPSQGYPGPYGQADNGWVIEHALQIDKMLSHVRERTGPRPLVLMGNFGASVGVDDDGDTVILGVAEGVTTRLTSELREAIPEGFAPQCTLCPDNALVRRESAPTAPTWLNRVYVDGDVQARKALRAYLGNVVEVEPAVHVGLLPVGRLPLSAQYAFRVHLDL